MNRKEQTCFPFLHLTVISSWATDSAVRRASFVEYEVNVTFGDSQFSPELK